MVEEVEELLTRIGQVLLVQAQVELHTIHRLEQVHQVTLMVKQVPAQEVVVQVQVVQVVQEVLLGQPLFMQVQVEQQ